MLEGRKQECLGSTHSLAGLRAAYQSHLCESLQSPFPQDSVWDSCEALQVNMSLASSALLFGTAARALRARVGCAQVRSARVLQYFHDVFNSQRQQ